MYIGLEAQNRPDKAAAIRPATGAIRTYRELDERSNRLAQLLYAAGLRRGDHVAMVVENCLEFFDVNCACMRSGLYVTPINRHLPAEEAAYIVDDCDARVLIVSAALDQAEETGRLSPRCTVKLSVGGSVPGFEEFESAIAQYPARQLDEEWLGATMLYSSGTTGKPKGVKREMLSVSPLENPGVTHTVTMFGADENTVYLCPAPLYHAAPMVFSGGTILLGGTVVVMDRFEPEEALALIDRYKVTHSQWVPTMFVRMLKADSALRSRYDLSSHRCAIHAAAPCPVEVKRQMIDWWGPIIEEYWASTEGAGFTRISSAEWLAHPGSVGRAMFQPIHICDDEGKELPPGEPGTIYGESFLGSGFTYHKDEGKTLSATHPLHPSWSTVGDIGYLDAEGFLYLTDRKAFMIISGGVNIYPQQIEDALALHPKVGDVAVIGVPNDELGEEVKAVVEPAPGVSPSDALAQEIMAFVRSKLGQQLTPRSVDFTDALPRMPTGKLQKKLLREKYWPG